MKNKNKIEVKLYHDVKENMSSFFGNIKKSLGISKEKDSKAEEYEVFDVIFVEQLIGLRVSENLVTYPEFYGRKPCVAAVTPGSEADRNSIRCGDVVVSIEGEEVAFSNFYDRLSTGRPICVSFLRQKKLLTNKAVENINDSHGHSNSDSSNKSSTFLSNTWKSLAGGAQPRSVPQLSEMEKKERREMALRAAENRDWNKKLEAKKKDKEREKDKQVK